MCGGWLALLHVDRFKTFALCLWVCQTNSGFVPHSLISSVWFKTETNKDCRGLLTCGGIAMEDQGCKCYCLCALLLLLFGISCTYVIIDCLISPAGTCPPGSGFAASCERPSNFWRLTKGSFFSVLLFYITQLQGTADLLKPLHCLDKTTY